MPVDRYQAGSYLAALFRESDDPHNQKLARDYLRDEPNPKACSDEERAQEALEQADIEAHRGGE